jgi:hypothetical protein
VVYLRSLSGCVSVADERLLEGDLDAQLSRNIEVSEVLGQTKARQAWPAITEHEVDRAKKRALPRPVRAHDGGERFERQVDRAMRAKVAKRDSTEHPYAN